MGTYLVTGGAGFIGSHFCRLSLQEKWCDRLVNVDSLTYAGNLNNLSSISGDDRYEFIQQDICEAAPILKIAVTSPDSPGAIALSSNSTVVQPQPGTISPMFTV